MLSTKEDLKQENRKLQKTVVFLYKQYEIFKEKQRYRQACRYCRYYLQHYIRLRTTGEFTATDCGHCIHGRIKGRKPLDKCEYFDIDEEFAHMEKGGDERAGEKV